MNLSDGEVFLWRLAKFGISFTDRVSILCREVVKVWALVRKISGFS